MLTGLHGKTMTYDGENRPLSVTHNGVRTEYVCGADGSRLQQVTAAGTASEDVITYLGPLEIRGDLSAPGEVVVHARTGVRLVDGVESYLHRDQLGSVVLITDATGAKAAETMYRPFSKHEDTCMV